MDPDAARERMISLANQVIGELTQSRLPDMAVVEVIAIDLAEAVHDLDEWLRTGGFLPEVWIPLKDRLGKSQGAEQPGRKQDMDIHTDGTARPAR